jgi:sensor histidine kinase YesM
MVLLLSMSLKFVKDYFVNINLRHRLQYQKVESELKQLKNQINPHFLFNVLSNIYSLAYMKSENTPVMISKLADMMRYVLYDCSVKKVSLAKEISYLQDFISLHQLCKENKMNIVFEVEGDPEKIMIQPLLLLPLFENCFKHGNLADIKHGWMKSKIKISEELLELTITNTFIDRLLTEKKSGGIGLKNTRSRLDLLYPNRYSLTMHSENHIFSLHLSIAFNEQLALID